MPQTNGAEIIARVCSELRAGQRERAVRITRAEYPWAKKELVKRTYSKLAATRIFRRDGFIDRYFGSRLVYPGALLLLGHLLPDEFPMHPTWKVSESHEIYWELWPAVDHIIPVSRGGSKNPENLISTSTMHNNAKGHWLPEELGWKIYPPGDLKDWDGLLSWFVTYLDQQPELLEKSIIKDWHHAAKQMD